MKNEKKEKIKQRFVDSLLSLGEAAKAERIGNEGLFNYHIREHDKAAAQTTHMVDQATAEDADADADDLTD